MNNTTDFPAANDVVGDFDIGQGDIQANSVGDRVGKQLANLEIASLAISLNAWSAGKGLDARAISSDTVTDVARHCMARLRSVADAGALNRSESATIANVLRAVVDAAISCTVGKAAPLSSLADYMRCIARNRPLASADVDAIFDAVLHELIEAELSGRSESLDVADFEKPRSILLARLDAMNWRFCRSILRRRAGFDALPGAGNLPAWLEAHRDTFHGILEKPIDELRKSIIPFGDPTHEIAVLSAAAMPDEAEAAWRRLAGPAGIDLGIGPWGEPRSVYTSDMFRSRLIADARRTIHLGLDLFMPAGTKVFAPLEGTVRGIDIEREKLSYGCLITLLHEPKDGPPFLSLWGHLSHEAAERLAVGERLTAGALVGVMGDIQENGGWASHLHLQICADTALLPVEIIGVGEKAYVDVWGDLFPSANSFARLDDKFQPRPSTP